MRAQKFGHIIQISSRRCHRGADGRALPRLQMGSRRFHISQALAAEVKDLGIKVTIIEPGGFFGSRGVEAVRTLASEARALSCAGNCFARPTAPALFKIVDAAEPPLRVFFGDAGLPMIRREYAERIATWEKWNDVSLEAQGNLQAHWKVRERATDLYSLPPCPHMNASSIAGDRSGSFATETVRAGHRPTTGLVRRLT
jgi:NAD(P)-dependent dehydrogenase (short-subunit alcohol dehydrogenase family)